MATSEATERMSKAITEQIQTVSSGTITHTVGNSFGIAQIYAVKFDNINEVALSLRIWVVSY